MLHLFVTTFEEWLKAHNLDFLRVFTFVTFQSALATLLGFILCIAFGPKVIGWLRRQKIGDLASFDQVEVDRLMEGKKGTPTMGGMLILAGVVAVKLGESRSA